MNASAASPKVAIALLDAKTAKIDTHLARPSLFLRGQSPQSTRPLNLESDSETERPQRASIKPTPDQRTRKERARQRENVVRLDCHHDRRDGPNEIGRSRDLLAARRSNECAKENDARRGHGRSEGNYRIEDGVVPVCRAHSRDHLILRTQIARQRF